MVGAATARAPVVGATVRPPRKGVSEMRMRTGLAVGLALQAAWCGQIAWSQPDVPGFVVEVYAELCEPVRISPDAAGFLYAGNGGCGGSNGGPAWVRRIDPGGLPIENYGNGTIDDPDSVLFDPLGFSGEPGSVLVGGGGVFAIRPDESIITVLEANGLLNNVADMRFDSAGRLLVLNLNPGRVAVSVSGEPVTELFTLPASTRSLTVAADDRIFTATGDGVIRIHSPDGTVIDDAFVTGLGENLCLAVGPDGVWGDQLYAISAGNLLRIDDEGIITVVGTGFTADIDDLEFGPGGVLYTSSDIGDQILRIGVSCEADLDGDEIVGIGDFLLVLAQWGPCPPECLGDVDGDGEVGILDLLLILASWGPCP